MLGSRLPLRQSFCCKNAKIFLTNRINSSRRLFNIARLLTDWNHKGTEVFLCAGRLKKTSLKASTFVKTLDAIGEVFFLPEGRGQPLRGAQR
jgi:hypothetical protein